MTPQQALQQGADYLVIGRPITQAENPQEAWRKIIDN
jgi:orotidine-5'-phosphate decarboxylase